MKPETKIIRKRYAKVVGMIYSKYPQFKPPTLRVTHHKNANYGFCNWHKREIAINTNHPKETFESTIIHEICHQLDFDIKNQTGQKRHGSHNVEFWLLCYEFGLTEKDYSHGLTNNMARAKKKFQEAKNG